MAYYYGVNAGDSEYAAAVSSSTTSKDVEIVVNQTNVTSKEQLILGIEALLNFVLKNGYPPV